jgi:heat shock protein HslJ
MFTSSRVLRRFLMLCLLPATLACAPAAEQSAPPATEAVAESTSLEPPTLDELAEATFGGIADEPVQLADGRWEGEPYVEGGASRPAIGLVEDFLLLGDLTGDGQAESVVLLWTSSGGSGTFDYLAAAGRDERGVSILGTAELGDRVKVRAGRIVDGNIEVDVVQAGPDDAACCPTQLATRTWTLGTQGLSEAEAMITGTLSIAVLQDREWLLAALDRDEPAPDEPEVTLTYDAGRIGGSSGCNSYFADVEEGGDLPGGISIGPTGSTRMMCPEAIMALEDRFLKQLGGVNRYGFLAGKLVLGWQEGEHSGSMIFTAREP